MATPSITKLIGSSFSSGNSSRTIRSKRLYTSYGGEGKEEGEGEKGEEGGGEEEDGEVGCASQMVVTLPVHHDAQKDPPHPPPHMTSG